MPKKKASKLTAEQAAEKARPNWKAVAPVRSDAPGRAEADETAPELDQLRRKYLGETADVGAKATRTRKANERELNKGKLKMVVMEPKTPSDTRVRRKTVLVDESGKIVGEQG